MIALWDEYMQRDPKAHLLNNTLRVHKPALPADVNADTVSDPQTAASFEVNVVNLTQVEVLEKERPQLLEVIRTAIGNDYFDFKINIDEKAAPVTAWSDRKVLDNMLERSPHLAKFIQDLKLVLS